MDTLTRILVVDDHPAVREGLRLALSESGHHEVTEAADAETALERILAHPPDLVVVDLNLPGRSGMDLITDLNERGIETTIVVLTAHASIVTAVEATRSGVFDYMEKPVDIDRLRTVVDRGLERTAMRRELQQLRREMIRVGRLDELVGSSQAMLEIYRLVEQLAPTNVSVLLTGESGTGKEVIARAIHRLSPRVQRPLVAVNCAAIPATLLESELFGHEKGAFTNATAARAGCFEQAQGGTLLLDEIAEMSVDLQSKLLRAIEEKKIRRVGGEREIPVDVRILSATNAHLESLLRDGKFREDLFFRLNVFHLAVPPLREHAADISALAEHFLRAHLRENPSAIVGFSDAALEIMKAYSWPGNVRELRNCVQRAAILCSTGEVLPAHLPPVVRGTVAPLRATGSGIFVATGTSLSQAERAIILDTLRFCQGNKPRAAGMLGISLKTLYTRLNLYEAERQGGIGGWA